MNIDEHLKALENLATAFTCKVRENIRLEKELEIMRERAERMERSRDIYKKDVSGMAAERSRLRQALDSIAHYVAENWTVAYDHPVLQRALEGAGYDVGAPGEPEPFIHGDNAEGAEG